MFFCPKLPKCSQIWFEFLPVIQCSILDQIYDSYCSLKKWSKLKPKKIFLAHSKTFLKYGICVCQVKNFSLFPSWSLKICQRDLQLPAPFYMGVSITQMWFKSNMIFYSDARNQLSPSDCFLVEMNLNESKWWTQTSRNEP